MLIEAKGKEDHLGKWDFNMDPDINKAAGLLYDIMDASYACCGAHLEAMVNGQRENIRSLYWKCRNLMEKIVKRRQEDGLPCHERPGTDL